MSTSTPITKVMFLRNAHKRPTASVLIATATPALLCSGPSLAQVSTPASPAMPKASPLASVDPAGIPLGSVELNSGGLSPTTLDSMSTSACSDVGMTNFAGSMPTFDGGG